MSGHVGISVYCSTCHLSKKPRGRSAPMSMENGLCGRDCPGYDEEPHVGSLWPGETCEDFGPYAHSHDGTKPGPRTAPPEGTTR